MLLNKIYEYNNLKIFSQTSRFSLTDEVYAIVRIDSHEMGSTDSKPISNHCWDQLFNLYLDRVYNFNIYYFNIF